MRTKPATSDADRIRAFHDKLSGPMAVSIAGATAYWLEADDGRRIGRESPTSEAPLAAALTAVGQGMDPLLLSLVCDVAGQGRYVIARGQRLIEMAEWAAGMAPPQQMGGSRQTADSGRSGHGRPA
jgi:hypothetical protein